MSIYLFDIIRMEREGVEKRGVEGLMSGVQRMGIGQKPSLFKNQTPRGAPHARGLCYDSQGMTSEYT